jgi:anti-sigma factor RsiW
MRDAEMLSRMLDGELPVRESEELRARMRVEPELAELYAALQGLPGELAELPDEAAPSELDRALVERPAPRRDWNAWAGWLVALGLIAVLGWPTQVPELTLIGGQQLIEGPAVVQLPEGRRVEVDGSALISVEPEGGALRESSQEDEMNPRLLIAAAAGAALTVTVYEGRALIHDGDAEPLLVEAGETHREQLPDRPQPRKLVANTDASASQTLAEAEARIEELEGALALASFSSQLKDGRLMALEGVPQECPADLDPAHAPQGFMDRLGQALEGATDAELVSVDCDEFPCLVTLTTDADGSDWDRGLRPVAESMMSSEDDGLSVWASGFKTDPDGPAHNYWTFAVTPADYAADEELKLRTGFRTDAITEELGQSVEELATQDVDEER